MNRIRNGTRQVQRDRRHAKSIYPIARLVQQVSGGIEGGLDGLSDAVRPRKVGNRCLERQDECVDTLNQCVVKFARDPFPLFEHASGP